MKKALTLILLLTMLIMLTIGCGENERTAKQIVLDSIDKGSDINSQTYSGKLDVFIDSDTKITEASPIMQKINKFTITFNGKQVNEPLQMEMNMDLITNVEGMDLNLDVPVIAKDDLMYFQVPAMLQPFMSELDKEYVAVDISNHNKPENKADSVNLFKTLINDIDESSFTKEAKNSYSLKGINVGYVVTINMTEESLKPFIENFSNDGLPELINYMDKYSIAEKLKIQLQQHKFELDSNSINIDKLTDNLYQELKLTEINMVNIYDKKGVLRKIIFDIDITINDNQQNKADIVIKGEYIIETINKNIEFERQIPSIEQTEKIG